MKWLYSNLLDTDTFTVTNEDTDYTFKDAFEDTRLSRFGRTTTHRNVYFDFDLGVQSFISYACILGHNLTSGATITLYGNTSNDWSQPAETFSLAWNASHIIQEISLTDYDLGWYYLTAQTGQYIGGNVTPTQYDYFLTDELGNQIVDEYGNSVYGFIWVIDTTVYNVSDELGNTIWGNIYSTGYRYWRLYIDDPYNADGYIEISKFFIGDSLTLPYMAKNQKLPTASTGTVSLSPTGQAYGDRGIIYHYGNVNFPYVTDDEKLSVDEAFESIDKVVPFIMLVWENDLTFQPALYSLLTTDLDWQRVEGLAGRFWSLNFSFREIF